jgi:hypothetical protein
MLITRSPGSSIAITCESWERRKYVPNQGGEGPTTRSLLRCVQCQGCGNSGLNQAKHETCESTDRKCKFILRNWDNSDSGEYYCCYLDCQGD